MTATPLAQAQSTQDTYVVNSTADADDALVGDGTCDDGTGSCTLRAAIEEANADADRDSISFENIPTTNGFATISLVDSLGTLEVDEEISIDGSTAPGYPSASANGPIVEVDGSNITGDILGVKLGTDGSRIVGLAFVNGAGEGIEVSPDGSVSNVSILDCFVGIDVDGTTVQGNLRNPDEFGDTAGISIVDANESRIDGNLVSGNQGDGILISGDNNTVTNNIVGLDHNSDAPKGNSGHGIHVASGSGNLIGDAFSVSGFLFFNGNTIAANGSAGVLIRGDGNSVFANLIGNDGSTAFPNSSGVVIEGQSSNEPAENNKIGSGDDIDQNTISGNQFNGIRLGNGASNLSANNTVINNNNIGTGSDGTNAIPNGNGSVEGGIRIDEGTGNEILNNVIAGNNANGIRLRGPSPNNTIQGNRIGVDVNGNPLGNNHWGIWIQTNRNTIGGVNSGDENIIGSNANAGIRIEGNSNSVVLNSVGTDNAGADIGNGANGIAVLGDNNGIDGNTVGNNSNAGILVRDASDNGIFGNYVGTNADGDSAPNGSEGVLIFATSGNSSNDNVVGSSDAANVIANNLGDGIRIGGDGSAIRNSVRFNQIFDDTNLGIDLGGGGVTANDAGDGDDGPNRLQNFPVLQDSEYDPDTDEVTVSYRVPSNPSEVNPQYPLATDFYVADADDQEGRAYLGTDTYSSVDPDDYSGCGAPPCTVATTFTPQSPVDRADDLVATATDGAGNTSEFSPAMVINFPPRFTDSGPFEVRETASEGTTVGDVDAANGEGGAADQGVGYRITAGNDPDENGTGAFTIDKADGLITVAAPEEIDFETRDQYALQVEADDGTSTEEATVTINVRDVPPPSVTTDPATNVSVDEAQLNATVNPNGASTSVTFTYYPTSDLSATTTVTAATGLTGNTDQSVSATISELDPNTQYGYTAEAASEEGTETGSEQTFTTSVAPPEATTDPAGNVGVTSAQLNGRVDPGGSETTVEFEYYSSGQPGESQAVVAEQSPLTGSEKQSVSATVEGLEPGGEYAFRVLAENEAGSDEGSEQTFTTGAAAPTATTGEATEVTANSAQLNGQVDPNGAETEAGFEYYPSGQPGESQAVVAEQSPLTGSGEQSVSATVDGLAPVMKYEFRVFAENQEGSTAGAGHTFTTKAAPPVVETGPVTDVTVTSAHFSGQVNPRGAETTVEFEYYPSEQPDQVQTVAAAESPLSGSDEREVSATVEDLIPETDYKARVVATNDGGTSRGDPVSFSTLPVEVAVDRSPEVPQRGAPLDVEVSVSEGFDPTELQLFYRRGGETDYRTRSLEASGTSTFVGSVPGSAVTERGLEFYVQLSERNVTATAPESNPSEQPFSVPVRVAQLEADVELGPEEYRMVSIPVRLDEADAFAQFEDNFGLHDRTEWRLLRWNPAGGQSACGAGQYREATPNAEPTATNLSPGRAFWLITRGGGTFDVEDARSVEAEPITLTLPPGWTQLANPRAYPVAWADVEGREALQNGSPQAYDPEAQGSEPYTPNVSVLEPWTGYWVCNPGSSPVEITIPPREASSPTSATAGEKTSSKDRLFERKLAYALQLKATLERDTGTEQKDVQNVVGVAPDATRSLGLEDVIEPPPIRDRLRLSIIEDGTRLAGSLRPETAEGHAWNLEVSAPVSEKASPPRTVRVQLEARGTRPSGFTRRLMDRDTGRRIPIEDGSFSVSLTEERPARHLRLLVGTETFAEAESEAVRPDRTGLRAVYPNPSRGRVSVDYQLKAAQRVQIRVYDVLGRRVETLVDERRPAGHHTVRWDGNSGTVASGLYIVRMEAGSTSASRRISIVR